MKIHLIVFCRDGEGTKSLTVALLSPSDSRRLVLRQEREVIGRRTEEHLRELDPVLHAAHKRRGGRQHGSNLTETRVEEGGDEPSSLTKRATSRARSSP